MFIPITPIELTRTPFKIIILNDRSPYTERTVCIYRTIFYLYDEPG